MHNKMYRVITKTYMSCTCILEREKILIICIFLQVHFPDVERAEWINKVNSSNI